MKKHYAFTALALALSLVIGAHVARSQGNSKNAGAEETAPGATIGQVISDFKLPDLDGQDRSLASLKGKSGSVLIFISAQCPVSNAYNERMAKLAQDYRAQGVNVIGINSNVTEPSDVVKRHAAEKNLTFPILKDNGNRIADQLGAQVTPEAYFLDANNKLVYRGRIDNSRNPATINSNDLREAINAVLQGKAVTKAQARAFGCTIKRVS